MKFNIFKNGELIATAPNKTELRKWARFNLSFAGCKYEAKRRAKNNQENFRFYKNNVYTLLHHHRQSFIIIPYLNRNGHPSYLFQWEN